MRRAFVILGTLLATSFGVAGAVYSAGGNEKTEVGYVPVDVTTTRVEPNQVFHPFHFKLGIDQAGNHIHQDYLNKKATEELWRSTSTTVKKVSRSASRVVTGDIWGALARCESGGNPRAVSSTGKYRGAFQFSIATWQGLGYPGDPIDHSYATQLEAAKKLQARSGWGQWPSCARQLGLI